MRLMLNTTNKGITECSCTLPETPSVCFSWGKSSFQTTPAICSCRYNDAEPGWQGHRKTKNTKLTHNILTGLGGWTNRHQDQHRLSSLIFWLALMSTCCSQSAIQGIYPALPGLADSPSSTSFSVYMCVKYLHSGLYLKGVCVSALGRNHEKLCAFETK